MGMSASQARFLSLTARKNNVEFEGQQINQQRTTLSNQSASYYSELCNMTVPTPPSVDDYTRVTYTFDDGALTNTVTAMLAKGNNMYSISFIQQWQDDYSIVSASSSLISKTEDGQYKIGTANLRKLGSLENAGVSVGSSITIDGITYQVNKDDGGLYVEKTQSVPSVEECSDDDIAKFEYYLFDDELNSATQVYKNEDGTFYSLEEDGTHKELEGLSEDDLIICLYDESQTDPNKAVILVDKDEETGNYFKETYKDELVKSYLSNEEIASITTFSDPYLSSLTPEQINDLLEQEKYYQAMLNDSILGNADSSNQWYVRYIKDSATGSYIPYFYQANEVEDEDKYIDGYATSNINCYSIGSSVRTREVLNQFGTVEKDSAGRYISLTLYQTDDDGKILTDPETGLQLSTTYSLTTNTTTDEDAYNDAMNKYHYEQNQYDKKIQEINSKLEVVQAQDKSLELNLKQLDTEENAISTEIDAVKKVISKNIDASFKTFNA